MRPFLTIFRKENPGSDFRRARAKYSNFDWWRQSYGKNSNFPLGTQA
jgi:hypothetical protein